MMLRRLFAVFPLLTLCLLAGIVPGLPSRAAVSNPANYPYILNSPVFDARKYGAKGNGTTDDRAAIQAALDAAKAAGGGTVYVARGAYLIKRPLFIASKCTLQGAGRGVTTITKPASIKSLLTANASALATSVTVASSTGFEVNGSIDLYDTSSFEWLSTQGKITGIAGNVITFANAEGLGRTGLDGSLQTARAATATTSFPLLRNEQASTRICVRDLTLDQVQNSNDPAPTSATVGGVCDFTIATIHWVETYYSVVEDCELVNASGDAYSDQAQDGGGSFVTSAANIKTTKNTIRFCKIRNATRHGTHFGTCMNGAWNIGNEITGCGWYAMFYCAFATNIVANGDLIEGCGSGFAGIDDRDSGNVIANNTIKGWSIFAIEAANGATGASGAEIGKCAITGNVIIGSGGSSGVITWNLPDCVFSGNYIDMGACGNAAISLGVNAHRSLIEANVIRSPGTGGSQGLLFTTVNDVRVIGNTLKGMATAASIRTCTRMVAIGNRIEAPTSAAWKFEVGASTDCVIKDERTNFATPVTESVATVRLVYEGIGTNGTNDPASAGDWNGISGRMHDGRLVRWNSGGGERISIFYNGVGWTALN